MELGGYFGGVGKGKFGRLAVYVEIPPVVSSKKGKNGRAVRAGA